MKFKTALLLVLILGFITSKIEAQQPLNPYIAPLYWSVYENNFLKEKAGVTNNYISETELLNNINWVESQLKPYGYKMICIDGWGDVDYNQYGYRTKHSSMWTHDFAWWSSFLKTKGMSLGMYANPLWVNPTAAAAGVKVKGTNILLSSLINSSENAKWFTWLQVDRPGAEEYVKGYIQHFADMGITYLRVDFLSWYESGTDRYMGVVGPARPLANYDKALRWMREACDANGMFLSLVMPNLYNDAATELKYGHMIRIDEDCAEGAWARFSDNYRGVQRTGWSVFANPFDGFIYWSKIAGRGKMILDGDFIRLNTFGNDEEKKSVVSLHLLAGGPVSIADQYNTIGPSTWIYQNSELLELNKDGFVGVPLSTNPANVGSQIWKGQLTNGDWIVGLFNRENAIQTRTVNFKTDLGIVGTAMVRDIWTHTDLGVATSISKQIPPHGCMIFRLKVTPQKAMYIGGSFNNWTASAMSMTNSSGNNWISSAINLAKSDYQFKFVNTPNWSDQDWGNATGISGIAQLTTGGLPNILLSIPSAGAYSFSFNDATLAYSVNSTTGSLVTNCANRIALHTIKNERKIVVELAKAIPFNVEIYSLAGELVLNVTKNSGDNTIDLNRLQSINSFIVRITTAESNSVFKVSI